MEYVNIAWKKDTENNMKITYTIEYNKYNKEWVIWKNIEKEQSIGFKPVFKGTKKECKKKLEELKNG